MAHPLEGKTISRILIAEDKEALKFETTEGDVIAIAYGDCCSTTWVEHVDLPARGFPALVQSVSNLDLDKPDEESEYSVIQFYGLKITTNNGDIVIDYRNESNGYYGGDLVFEGSYAWYSRTDEDAKWMPIAS